jgi:hypothetical protein
LVWPARALATSTLWLLTGPGLARADEAPSPAEPASAPSAPAPEGQKPSEAEPPAPEPVEVTIREPVKPADSTTLTRAETRTIPGGFGDPFRVIESIPSVVPLASGVPYFYVRGAPPGNIGYFLDGIRVPLLFHLGLGPSVIHPALIDRVDVSPGSNPELGRYAGGVVAGTITAPREELRVEGNLRAVDTGAFLEVPFDGGRGDVLAAGRFSYTALLFSLINSSTVLNYWDYAARASYEISPGHRVGVLGFGAYDHLGEKPEDEDEPEKLLVDTMFHRLDVFYDVRVDARTQLRYDVVLGWDETGFDEEKGVVDRSLNVRGKLTSRLHDDLEVLAGIDLAVDDYEADLADEQDEDQGGFPSFFSSRLDLAMGLYAIFPMHLGDRLSLRPGLRADVYASGTETEVAVDPSISARLEIVEGLALVSAHGLASQMPSFIVAGPGFRPGLDKRGLQRAFSSSLALEWRPDADWNLKVGGYRSTFFELNDALGTSALGEEGFPEGFDDFDDRFDGTSTGLEISVRRRLSRAVGAILTYSLGRSERSDRTGRTFPSGFDRTHVATAAVTADFTHGFKGGVRQLFYTGAPLLDVREDEVLVRKRLPPFYRIDTRFEKRWTLGKTGFISLVVEVLNTFLAQEVLGEDCVVDDAGRQRCSPSKLGPVTIPSLGLEGGY